ncbi:MAG: GntR family transcriptional regulator [Actinomycetales bacterium]|uniref:GntR family transcriptional regulator n=1 Tax=Candidatus Phosphoribacter hodrii TaxID=2953743 RepID=A0A935IN06_9MICO|nr:GntR family transcriptional regulator [Candidatus Phosphoribacter hodrii]
MAGTDFTPLYVHLSQQVRGQILGGEIAPGEAIPSEAQLMERFRTTRGTVRAAIDILVNEGLVRRVHGKGTFVQLRPVTRSILNFGGLTDSLDGRSERAISRVVTSEQITLDGRDFCRLVRLRGIESGDRTDILSLDTSLLPLDLFPGLLDADLQDRSLYQLFRERYGVYPRRTQVRVTTAVPDEATRRLLEERPDCPALLQVEGSAFDAKGVEIERMKVLYSSRAEFNLTTAITEIPGGSS